MGGGWEELKKNPPHTTPPTFRPFDLSTLRQMLFFQLCALGGALLYALRSLRAFRVPRHFAQRYSRDDWMQQRSRVRASLVPWRVRHPDYRPVISGAPAADFWWFRRTFADGTCRFLFEVSPKTFALMPTNPYGRTGCRGLGKLKRPGGNFVRFTVIRSPLQSFIRLVEDGGGFQIYTGYIDHPLNTDNAWLEGTVSVRYVEGEYFSSEFCEPWLRSILNLYGNPAGDD